MVAADASGDAELQVLGSLNTLLCQVCRGQQDAMKLCWPELRQAPRQKVASALLDEALQWASQLHNGGNSSSAGWLNLTKGTWRAPPESSQCCLLAGLCMGSAASVPRQCKQSSNALTACDTHRLGGRGLR